MNAKIATVLSLVGVLVAGSAAALVNTSVFDGASDSAVGSPSAVDPPNVAATLATVPGTATEGLVSFEVGTAGVVTLDNSGPLSFVSAEAAPGWTASAPITGDDGSIELSFTSTAGDVTFNGSVIGGQVVARVATSAASLPSTSTSVTAASVSTPDVSSPDVSGPDSSAPDDSTGPSVSVDDDDDHSGSSGGRDDDSSGSGSGGKDDD